MYIFAAAALGLPGLVNVRFNLFFSFCWSIKQNLKGQFRLRFDEMCEFVTGSSINP